MGIISKGSKQIQPFKNATFLTIRLKVTREKLLKAKVKHLLLIV